MDENGQRESSNRAVVPKDSATTAIASSTTTIAKIVDKIPKSDPMIIPTSSPTVNGNASPSPSKRMRYELVISTPKRDDRKSTHFVVSPKRFVVREAFEKTSDDKEDERSDVNHVVGKDVVAKDVVGKDVVVKNDDNDEKCDRSLKEGGEGKAVVSEENDMNDEFVRSNHSVDREGFRLLGDAENGSEDKDTNFKEKLRTLLWRQRNRSPLQSGVENLQIKAMLPERYSKTISTGHVLVAKIFDRTKSALFLQAFCQAFRLPENLSHLKRVKSEKTNKDGGKPEVILHLIIREIPPALISDDNDDVQLSLVARRYFAECLRALSVDSASPEDLTPHLDAIGDPYVARVSASAPLTRAQYEAARALWPCTFHEDKRISSLIDGRYFSASESEVIRRNLSLTLGVAEEAKTLFGIEGDCDACVIVDPRENQVVAVAHDLSQFEDDDRFNDRIRDRNAVTLSALTPSSSSSSFSDDDDSKAVFTIRPYYHAPMVAIDLAAVSQGGGAYSIPLDRFVLMTCDASSNSITTTSTADDAGPNTDDDDDGDSSGNVTYLCTGFDVYLSKEPCLMCAMSLIHSRIRRLFYRHKTSDGALGSKFSIHTLDSLNHHFEAFRLE